MVPRGRCAAYRGTPLIGPLSVVQTAAAVVAFVTVGVALELFPFADAFKRDWWLSGAPRMPLAATGCAVPTLPCPMHGITSVH